jgi:hypothetical protein
MLLRALGTWQHAGSIVAHQGDRLVEVAMGVNVNGLHALAVDHDGRARRGRLCARRIEQAATAERNAARGSARDEASSRGHATPSRLVLCRNSGLRPACRPF